MYINSLVFSNEPKFRISRHVLFWLCWISYFTIEATLRRSSMYNFHVAFLSSVTEVMGSTPIDMAFCYSILYFLFPRFLFRDRYVSMVILWLIFAVACFFVYHSYNMYIVPHIHQFYGMKTSGGSGKIIWAFFYFFLTFNMEGCLAAAIKLGKMWYIKRKENDVLTFQKEKMEAFIPNGNTPSAFLFHTFGRIHDLSAQSSPGIASMISRLQKITLFTLSQYQHTQVDVENELQILRELINLHRETSNDLGVYSLEVSGDMTGKRIAPFLLLPLAENIFSQLINRGGDAGSVHIKVSIQKEKLRYEIVHSKPPETSTLTNGKRETLYKVNKRLAILYPGGHRLTTIIEANQVKTNLEIDLDSIILT